MHYKFIFILLFFIFSPKVVSAENVLIEFTKFDRYSIEVVHIDVGDKVEWVPKSNGHNVEFIAGPDGWKAPKKSKLSKEYTYTFDTPGVYLYQCSPHKTMGMIAIVIVGELTQEGVDAIKGAKVKGKSKKKLKALLADL